MDADAVAELRRLRARAYGPDADISDDPVALARLEELEARPASPEPATIEPAVEESAPSIVSPIGTTEPSPSSATEAQPGAPAPESAATRRRWLPRRRRTRIVAASIALVAVVAITATATTFLDRRAVYGAGLEAVLTVASPEAELPEFLGGGGASAVRFAEFAGLTPFYSDGLGWSGSDGCLVLVRTDDLDREHSPAGFVNGACAAGVFPATMAFRVEPNMPPALLERFPEGTALKFSHEGDRVIVMSAADDAET